MRAVVALVMFAVLAAPAAAKTHHPPTCVKHHGQRACRVSVKLAAPSTPPLQKLLDAAATAPAKKHKHRIPAKTLKRALKGLSGLDALAAKLDALHPATAARAHAADAATENVSAGGWSGSATVDIPLHSDATGVDVTATATVGKGDTKASVKKVDQHLVAQCPDASGTVPGTAKQSTTMQIEAPAPNGRTVKFTITYQAETTLTGHTATDGTLRDWDQSQKFLAHVQIAVLDGHKVVETTPPLVWTSHAAATLTPDEKPDVPDGVRDTLEGPGIFKVFGIKFVATDWQAGAASHVVQLAAFMWLVATDNAKQDLLKAKAEHWDTGDCVKLSLSAPKHELAAGESVPVTSTLAGPAGKGVAPATLTTSATNGAVVTPTTTTADSAPLTLTTIAPTPFKPGDTFQVTVNAVSKQGRGSAYISLHAPQGAYQLVYTHTTTGSTTYGYDHSAAQFTDTGTWTENRDVQVSATVPLTAGADGSYSGSGPIRWDRSTWSQENNEHSNEGQQYPSFCDLDDHETVTATTPGTLTVSSLDIDTPSATVKLASLGENWHQNDVQVAGPCPGRVDDYPRNTLLGEIGSDHYGAGDHVFWPASTEVDITLSTGWTPGVGDVVATKTVSGQEYSGPDGKLAIPFTDRFEIVRVT